MGRKIILLVFGIAVLLLILFVLCGELKPLPAVLGGGLLLLFDPLNSRLKNSSAFQGICVRRYGNGRALSVRAF